MRVLIFVLLSLVSFAEYYENPPSAAECALPGFDCSKESTRQLKKTNLALRKALRSLTVEQGVGRDAVPRGRETKIGASNHGFKHVRKAGEQAVGGYKLGEGCSSDAECPGLDTCWSTECWPAYVEPVCYSDSDCPGWADICYTYYDGTAECYDPFMSGRETKIGASNHGFKNEASVGRKRKTAAKKTESDTNKEHSAEKEIGLAKANTRLLKSNKMLLHALKKVSATSDGISRQHAVGFLPPLPSDWEGGDAVGQEGY